MQYSITARIQDGLDLEYKNGNTSHTFSEEDVMKWNRVTFPNRVKLVDYHLMNIMMLLILMVIYYHNI